VKIALLIVLAATLTGCGSATLRTDRKSVEGVDCVVVSTADGGAGVDCNFPEKP
jgi:uncharacterized protein YceK